SYAAQAPSRDGGALTAVPFPTQQVPGGHPVDEQQMRALLSARFGSLRQCLNRAAEEDPRLLSIAGDVIGEFTIGPSGASNVRIVRNDFTPSVAACMDHHLSELPIPPDPLRWTSLFRYGVRSQPTRIER